MEGFSDTPIIAVSADAFIQQQRIAKKAGVNHYITKPIDLKKLMPILGKYLIREEFIEEASKINEEKETGKTTMPEEVQSQLTEAISDLVEISAFKFGDLLKQIKKTKNIIQSYDPLCKNILTELEDAVFESNTEQVEDLLKKITHG